MARDLITGDSELEPNANGDGDPTETKIRLSPKLAEFCSLGPVSKKRASPVRAQALPIRRHLVKVTAGIGFVQKLTIFSGHDSLSLSRQLSKLRRQLSRGA